MKIKELLESVESHHDEGVAIATKHHIDGHDLGKNRYGQQSHTFEAKNVDAAHKELESKGWKRAKDKTGGRVTVFTKGKTSFETHHHFNEVKVWTKGSK